jgi:post-segregation antitoxin (ccd killing protein)
MPVGLPGSYITVSTKVRREVVERAKALGINVSRFLREKLEEEVEREELELLKRELNSLRDALEAIDVERIVKDVREDRGADARPAFRRVVAGEDPEAREG